MGLEKAVIKVSLRSDAHSWSGTGSPDWITSFVTLLLLSSTAFQNCLGLFFSIAGRV